MKIAVSSRGKELDSEVDQRFGRAAYFVVVDSETFDFVVVDNQAAAQAMQGAGIQAAKAVANKGAEVLLTGNCGPKAFTTLNTAGIDVVLNVGGTVRSAVEGFNKGDFQTAGGPNVDPHW